MEEYRHRVINLHAIQSQNISKFTSNISKNTSKFTSETDQIRCRGAMGGLNPYGASPRLCFAPPPGQLDNLALGVRGDGKPKDNHLRN